MPNFKPETLEAVEKLYLKHLGYIPLIIVNADKGIESLKEGNFLRESSLVEKSQESSISTSFINFLGIVSAGVDLITDNNYCTPVHLVLKEFLEWAISFNKEDDLQELSDTEARIQLYKALFLSEKNLMEISSENRPEFTLGIVGCETVIATARKELDIFVVHPLLDAEITKLNRAFENFNKFCYQSGDNPLFMYLYNNLGRELELLNGYFTELSNVFATTCSKGWLLEQQRQDMRVQSEFIISQIARIIEGMKSIFSYAKSEPQVLTDLGEAKKESAKILNLFTKISLGMDVIQWRIGTDIGRIQGIRHHSGLTGHWALDKHQRQESSAIVDEENVEQVCAFNS